MSTFAQRVDRKDEISVKPRSKNAEAVARYAERNRAKLYKKRSEYYWKNRDIELEKNRLYWKNNPEKRKIHYARRQIRFATIPEAKARRNEVARIGAFRLRMLVLEKYGGHCQCCHEKRNEFLAIDHINGCSKELRAIQRGGTQLYRWLKNNNFPSGYQVLCHNCNMAKSLYGTCPHKKIKVA